MIKSYHQTPIKSLSKLNSNIKSTQDNQTNDTFSFGQRSGKSSNDQSFIQKQIIPQALQSVRQTLFINSYQKPQTLQMQNADLIKQQQETDKNNELYQEEYKIITEKQYQTIVSQDLINLREIQWLIKTFNKNNNILNSIASKVANKIQGYLKKSIFKPKIQKKIEFQEYLIEQIIPVQNSKNQKQYQGAQQFMLICNEYILYSNQAITKCLQFQFAPYRQLYLQSLLLVIDDLSTFKKLANDDIKNEFCQIIQEIEKNMCGKDQKKYARQVYSTFVKQMFKTMQKSDNKQFQ